MLLKAVAWLSNGLGPIYHAHATFRILTTLTLYGILYRLANHSFFRNFHVFYLSLMCATIDITFPVPHDSIQTVILVSRDLLLRVVPPLMKER